MRALPAGASLSTEPPFRAICEALADCRPPIDDDFSRCMLCEERISWDEVGDDYSFVDHGDECPWRMAREAFFDD